MNFKKRTFHVHLIESNAPGEPFAEGEAFAAIFKILKIEAHRHRVEDENDLIQAFEKIKEDPDTPAGNHRYVLPWFHFALHADADGILLSRKKRILWKRLFELLGPLREKLEGNLMICMSACYGFYGYKMAQTEERYTYYTLIGPRKDILWQDSVLAYHVFYNKLLGRKSEKHVKSANKSPTRMVHLRRATRIKEAVDAMNRLGLSEAYRFGHTNGYQVRREFLEKNKSNS